MPKIKKPKKPKPYPRRRAHPLYMGDGSKPGKPGIVIDDDRVMEYVGIGWIEIRKATKADLAKYPKLTD